MEAAVILLIAAIGLALMVIGAFVGICLLIMTIGGK